MANVCARFGLTLTEVRGLKLWEFAELAKVIADEQREQKRRQRRR